MGGEGGRPTPGRPAGRPYGGGSRGGGDGRSRTLPQEGGDACADAGGVDDYSAASPHVFENVNEGREDLCVGLTRPPVVFDHTDGWELRPEAVVEGTEFTDGDDGGVARGLNGPDPANGGLFRFAGEVYAGDVNAPGTGGVVPAVVALEEGLPGGVQEPSIVGNGGEAVLGEEEGVIAAEAKAFGLDVALVVRVGRESEGIGGGEEARGGSRAVRYRSGSTGPD